MIFRTTLGDEVELLEGSSTAPIFECPKCGRTVLYVYFRYKKNGIEYEGWFYYCPNIFCRWCEFRERRVDHKTRKLR